MTDSQTAKDDSDSSVELLRAQALIEVEYQQRQASTATFVRAIRLDFFYAISDLHRSNPELKMWREWFDEALNTPQNTQALVNQVATLESDAPVVNVRYRRRVLNSRFHPATESEPAFFVATLSNEDAPSQASMLIVRNAPDGLFFETHIVDGLAPTGTYTPETLKQFLSLATQRLLKI